MLFDWRPGWGWLDGLCSVRRNMVLFYSLVPLSEVGRIAGQLSADLRILVKEGPQILVVVQVLFILAQGWVSAQVSIDVLVLIEESIEFCGLLVRQIRSIRGSSVCVDTPCDFPRVEPIVPVHEVRGIRGELLPRLRVFVKERSQILMVTEILLVIDQGRILSEILVDVLVVAKELVHLVAVPILVSIRIAICRVPILGVGYACIPVAILVSIRIAICRVPILGVGYACIPVAILVSIRVAICRIPILGVGYACVSVAVLVLSCPRLSRIESVLPLHEKRGIFCELLPHIRMIVQERPKILVLIEICFVVCQRRIRC